MSKMSSLSYQSRLLSNISSYPLHRLLRFARRQCLLGLLGQVGDPIHPRPPLLLRPGHVRLHRPGGQGPPNGEQPRLRGDTHGGAAGGGGGRRRDIGGGV